MAEYDSEKFNQYMQQASLYHRIGDYDNAIAWGKDAYDLAPSDSMPKGRAARDLAAHHEAAGQLELAYRHASLASVIHNNIVVREPENTGARRERGMSYMYMGTIATRQVIAAHAAGRPAPHQDIEITDCMAQSAMDLRDAKKHVEDANVRAHTLAAYYMRLFRIDPRLDQYDINFLRRDSAVHAALETGDKQHGLKVGMQAVAIAFMSESPLLQTRNPDLTTAQRLAAKGRAFIGGSLALTANILAVQPIMAGKRLGLRIADKVL